MTPRPTLFLIACSTFAFAASAALAAGLSPAPHASTSGALVLVKDDKPIDESCLMVCVKWNGDNCEKFEQKCKGDPGYPTGNEALHSNSGTVVSPGNGGTVGHAGAVKITPGVKAQQP
jgi:hypothetical protein